MLGRRPQTPPSMQRRRMRGSGKPQTAAERLGGPRSGGAEGVGRAVARGHFKRRWWREEEAARGRGKKGQPPLFHGHGERGYDCWTTCGGGGGRTRAQWRQRRGGAVEKDISRLERRTEGLLQGRPHTMAAAATGDTVAHGGLKCSRQRDAAVMVTGGGEQPRGW
ncbi:LacI family transcriptional regulator [Sesbania bispinosa]|nr:LacI family transcriptional regulator [Sesbania bispinosa]